MGVLVGVDVGGTFTDVVAIDMATGEVKIGKVPSTPDNQAKGILQALKMVDTVPSTIDTLIHGTTVGTNALLERRGSRCGLITTRGFRDLLELGRRTRPTTYGLIGKFEPLIHRSDRFEVDERTDADGTESVPLDEEAVREAARHLRERGVESLVVHFMHAYETPSHERRAVAIAAEEWPNQYLTQAAELLPAIREFERLMTAVVNAYVQPLIHRYVERLETDLLAQGFKGQFVITQSTGGAVSPTRAWTQAARTVLSGPAAGVVAAAQISRAAGFKHVVSCDMGGTSFDVALIIDGAPHIATEKEIEFRIPLSLPMIDIETIGAGGGSIASVDPAGSLTIGPRSAGSVPGPICYNRGGTEPTITDANVLLGRLDPAVLPAGSTPQAIESVFRHTIAGPLNLSVEAAAEGILRLANNKMAMAVRSVSTERGYDPRDFSLVSFGGGGPLHAVAIAREIGIPNVVIPFLPGVTCAYGCLLGEVRHDFVQTASCRLDAADARYLSEILSEHADRGRSLIAQDVGVTLSRILHEAEVQYEGQSHVLRLSLDGPELDIVALDSAFRKSFQRRFGVDVGPVPCRLVNLRTAAIGYRSKIDLKAIYASIRSAFRPKHKDRERQVYIDGRWMSFAIVERFSLVSGQALAGPMILEQPDTTIFLDPGSSASVDDFGNLIVDCRARA